MFNESQNIVFDSFLSINLKQYFPDIEFNARALHDFSAFHDILIEHNSTVNLVADSSTEEVVFRHIIDSLMPIKYIQFDHVKSLFDIGSGAGLPGIPLKIAYPNVSVTSVESIHKKCNFQKVVIEEVGLADFNVLCDRAENVGVSIHRETADIVISRALATMSVLIEISLPLLKIGGSAVFFKNAGCDDELNMSANSLKLCGGTVSDVHHYRIREKDPERCLILVQKTRATESKYPRRAGMPFKRPL